MFCYYSSQSDFLFFKSRVKTLKFSVASCLPSARTRLIKMVDESGILSVEETELFNQNEDEMITRNLNYAAGSQQLQVSDAREDVGRPVESQSQEHMLATLIELVRDYPCLWNTTCRSFKEKPKKDEAWRRICLVLGIDSKCYKVL